MGEMGPGKVCPKCGYDAEKDTNLTYALKPYTILHGKYLIGKVLGQGGFGITYIGFDLALELKVAIKEYFPFDQASRNIYNGNNLFWQNALDSTEYRHHGFNTFLAEARKMAKINNIPEIVSVRDTFEENKTAYIVMDYVPGMTLKDYIAKNGVMTYDQALNLLNPLILGLERAHRQGIIHRDISPSNLMLSPQGKVYLLDLGAAKDVKKSTGKSEMVATKGYSPMEQYTSSSYTGPWTDVYSMTATIYYCLFGKTPPAAIDRVESDTLSFKGKTKKSLTAKQIAVLKKGLALNKADRYQSIQELLNALLSVRKKGASKGLLIGVAVATALVVLAAVIILLTTTLREPAARGTVPGNSCMVSQLTIEADSLRCEPYLAGCELESPALTC